VRPPPSALLWECGSCAHLRPSTCVTLTPQARRSIWYLLPWAIIGGPVVSLHVILQLKDTPHGKQIAYQEVMALLCCCQQNTLLLREVLLPERLLEHTLIAVQGS